MHLDLFKKAKEAHIASLLQKKDWIPYQGQRQDFETPLRKSGQYPAIIAEYKRASPSKGILCQNLDAASVALEYAHAGASCMSVLTEKTYFDGDIRYLEEAHESLVKNHLTLPLLRKDFLFEECQIAETAQTKASALLLIVRLTPSVSKLTSLIRLAESFGISCVVEIFCEEELLLARKSGAHILQVNARDLDTLKIDMNLPLTLAKKHPPKEGEIWIQASGISQKKDLLAAKEAGFAACLLGTCLMQGGNPGKSLAKLLA